MSLKEKIKLAILASGEGTNAENIIKTIQEKYSYSIEVAIVLTDVKNAKVIERAKKYDILTLCLDKTLYKSKKEHEEAILKALFELNISWICLAGYMRLLSSAFISNFKHSTEDFFRILNIHPSLLPQYPGKDSYRQAFDDKCDFSGVTVHLVDEGMDTGSVILQESFRREKDDTLEEFTKRGRKLEEKLYPMALEFILDHGI